MVDWHTNFQQEWFPWGYEETKSKFLGTHAIERLNVNQINLENTYGSFYIGGHPAEDWIIDKIIEELETNNRLLDKITDMLLERGFTLEKQMKLIK